MEERNVFELVTEALGNMKDYDLAEVWNRAFEEDTVYSMDDFDRHFDGYSILDFINEFSTSELDSSDNWFIVRDGYRIESACDVFDLIDVDELARYIVEEEDPLGNDAIAEILFPPVKRWSIELSKDEAEVVKLALDMYRLTVESQLRNAEPDTVGALNKVCRTCDDAQAFVKNLLQTIAEEEGC